MKIVTFMRWIVGVLLDLGIVSSKETTGPGPSAICTKTKQEQGKTLCILTLDNLLKSAIINNVKREQEVPQKGLSDLFDNSVTNKFSKKFEIPS